MVAFLKTVVFITSSYGVRTNPVTGEEQFHNGIDLRASFLPLYSPESGIVEVVGEDDLNGRYVIINHGEKKTIYCHLSEVYTYKGAKLVSDELFAKTGNSGRSTGPHLHFGLKTKNSDGSFDFINPLPYIYTMNLKTVAKYSVIPIIAIGTAYFLTTKG